MHRRKLQGSPNPMQGQLLHDYKLAMRKVRVNVQMQPNAESPLR